MGSNTVSPRFARFTDSAASAMPWISLAIGAGLIGLSIWGVGVSRSTIRSYSEPSHTGPSTLAVLLTWCILFGPFAALGVYAVRSTLRRMRMSRFAWRPPFGAEVHIQPAQTAIMTRPTASMTSSLAVPDRYASPPINLEPLDDATTYRLNQLAARGAKIANVGAALFLLILGVSGLVALWIYVHRPFTYSSSREYMWLDFRLVRGLLPGCILATLVGLAILRDVFKKTYTARLIRLEVPAGIAGRRAPAAKQ